MASVSGAALGGVRLAHPKGSNFRQTVILLFINPHSKNLALLEDRRSSCTVIADGPVVVRLSKFNLDVVPRKMMWRARVTAHRLFPREVLEIDGRRRR